MSEGSATKQNGVQDFKIPKISPRFRDFKISQISNGISRFQVGFQDFKLDSKITCEISRFQVRFQDFERISRFQWRFVDFQAEFYGVQGCSSDCSNVVWACPLY